MSIPFLCQWLEVIFPDLRFANCRKVWVYIYAKPAAAGGGGAESCLLSIHFGWDSENCSICSVADTAPSPATTATMHNNQLLYSLYICKKCVFSFYAQHSLEDSLDAVYHMLAHYSTPFWRLMRLMSPWQKVLSRMFRMRDSILCIRHRIGSEHHIMATLATSVITLHF